MSSPAKFDDAGQAHKRQFTRAVHRTNGCSFKVGADEPPHDSSAAAGRNVSTLMRGESSFNVNSEEIEERRRKINAQSAMYRKQIRNMRSMTFDPHSKAVQRWDVITSLALLFTATVTPFEVGIVEPSPLDVMLTQPLFWINRAVDSIFITDIVLQCFLAYQEPAHKGGAWVHSLPKIFRHYASSWMPLDVVTAVPVDVVVAVVEKFMSAADDSMPLPSEVATSSSRSGALQAIRMMRLVKLLRILRSARIFKRWQAHMGLSFALLALLKFSVLTVVMAHWLACFWVLAGRLSDPVPPGSPALDPHRAFEYTWIHKAGLEDATIYETYGVALYVALTTIFSGSGGTIVPANSFEYYCQSLMMLLGSSVWAYVISSGCGIIATLDPNGVHCRRALGSEPAPPCCSLLTSVGSNLDSDRPHEDGRVELLCKGQAASPGDDHQAARVYAAVRDLNSRPCHECLCLLEVPPTSICD